MRIPRESLPSGLSGGEVELQGEALGERLVPIRIEWPAEGKELTDGHPLR